MYRRTAGDRLVGAGLDRAQPAGSRQNARVADTERAVRRPADQDDNALDIAWLLGRVRAWTSRAHAAPPSGEQLALFGPAPTLPTLRSVPFLRRRPRAGTVVAPPPGGAAPVPVDLTARYLLAAVLISYIGLFSYWTIRNHHGMGTYAFDFGIYDQGLWLLSKFKSPFVTVMGRQLFGDHTSFILLPLVPVYWVFPSANVLLLSQAGALGLGALPTFLIAREKLRDEMLAAMLAAAFVLQPVLGWTNLEHFHPDVFEVPLALFALWFMTRERWVPYFVCLGLLLMVKEDVVLFALLLGIYVAVKHDRRVGLATSAVAVIYALVALKVVLPHLNGVGTLNGWRIPFGGPVGLLRTTVAHPGRVIAYVTAGKRLWYLWQLFAPLALLALAAPGVLFIGIGVLAANVLSTFVYQYDIHYHYSTLILPVIVTATIFAIARWPARADRKKLVVVVLGASLVTAYMWGPTPLGRHEAFIADPGSSTVAHFHEAAKLLPADAVVSTYYGWLPQIDHREEVYMFPTPFKAAYWGTFKQEGQRLPQADRVEYLLLPSTLDPEPKAVFDGIRSGFDVLYDQGGVMLLRRKP